MNLSLSLLVLGQVEVSGIFSYSPPRALRHMFLHNRSSFPISRRHLANPVTRREEMVLRVMLCQCYSVMTLRTVIMKTDFFSKIEESEDFSSDSDSDLGDRDHPSQRRS